MIDRIFDESRLGRSLNGATGDIEPKRLISVAFERVIKIFYEAFRRLIVSGMSVW
jgi:hypothetical protein